MIVPSVLMHDQHRCFQQWCCVVLSILVLAVSVPGRAQEGNEPAAPMPLTTLFDPGRVSELRLSHDGTRVAWTHRLGRDTEVVIEQITPDGLVEQSRYVLGEGVAADLQWAYTNQHLVYMLDEDGSQVWWPYVLDLESGTSRDLLSEIRSPFSGRISRLSPTIPDEVLIIAGNSRTWQKYRVSLSDGATEAVTGEYGMYFLFDDQFRMVASRGWGEDGNNDCYIWRPTDEDPGWENIARLPAADLFARWIDVSADGSLLYIIRGGVFATLRLVEVDVKTRQEHCIAANRRYDIQRSYPGPAYGEQHVIIWNPRTHVPEAACFFGDQQEWVSIGNAIADDLEFLDAAIDGQFNVIDRSLDDARWLIETDADIQPRRFFLYERETSAGAGDGDGHSAGIQRSLQPLQPHDGSPAASADCWTRMHPVHIDASDGFDIPCYLLLPRWLDTDADGRPDDGPIPTVIYVHGGPFTRECWGFNPVFQWLADRGYAVMVVNYRGSIGYGIGHALAATGHWHDTVCRDLSDAADWAVEQGIARNDQIALYGRSMGGYLVLRTAGVYPELAQCVVAENPCVDLLLLAQEGARDFGPWQAWWKECFALDYTTEEGAAQVLSWGPGALVGDIQAPLLVLAGTNDNGCPVHLTDSFVSSAVDAGVRVSYLRFTDEGHHIQNFKDIPAHRSTIESFLQQTLGGRAESVDVETMSQSHVQMVVNGCRLPWHKDAIGFGNDDNKDAVNADQ